MQESLTRIFRELRTILKPYVPPLVARTSTSRRYEVFSVKNIVILGRERSETFFGGAIVRKDYVGFYFMPLYAHPELLRIVPPELKKLLKGKSCFHLRTLDRRLLRQIQVLTRKGFTHYKSAGWV